MRCRSTSSFSVLINGEAKGFIHPQRGLWQDCPLSPYSFIICTEAFSNLVVQVESRHLIYGLKFSRDLSISHILFADDNLIFTTATTKDCINLKAIFYCYATTSRKNFNYDKYSMFFSGKVHANQVANIKKHFQASCYVQA